MTDTNPTLDLTPPPVIPPFEATPAEQPITRRAADEAPRTRWAAIIWGLALAVTSATALWITLDAGRRDAVAEWVVSLSPPAIVASLLLAAGAIALVGGLVGIARRLQRGPRAAASSPPTT
ncbi:hypothetical protein ACFC1I_11945 [Microbacterium sp. NPDC056044]|uniref:hypothetical protein n=1 Tax=Microbacterium sp. NPDC056044 TaxID=3345690 RepID=UPI0035E354E4